MTINTGLIGPDKFDSRDYQLEEYQPAKPEEAPQDVSIYNLNPRWIESQDGKGVCYSYKVTGTQEFSNTKEYGKDIKLSERGMAALTKKVSGLYNMQGDYSRNCYKAAQKFGIPLEKDVPTDLSLPWEEFIRPDLTDEIMERAKKFVGLNYYRVEPTIEKIKYAMWKNTIPIGLTMPWYSSYFHPEPDGRLPLPSGNNGWHAILTGDIHYSDERFWLANSFGTNYGKNGYAYIPFEDFDKYEIRSAQVFIDKKELTIMFKLRRHPEKPEEVYAVNEEKKVHIVNPYTLFNGADLNMWDYQEGGKIKQATKEEWSKYEGNDEVALMPTKRKSEGMNFTYNDEGNMIFEVDKDYWDNHSTTSM